MKSFFLEPVESQHDDELQQELDSSFGLFTEKEPLLAICAVEKNHWIRLIRYLFFCLYKVLNQTNCNCNNHRTNNSKYCKK